MPAPGRYEIGETLTHGWMGFLPPVSGNDPRLPEGVIFEADKRGIHAIGVPMTRFSEYPTTEFVSFCRSLGKQLGRAANSSLSDTIPLLGPHDKFFRIQDVHSD